jgi:LCP family protein required for cell wall assembly
VILRVPDAHLLPGQYGPVARGGRPGRGPDWRRVLLFVGATLGLFGILGAGTVGALVWYGERQVNRIDVDGMADPDAQRVNDVLNVLLVGSDSREGLTREQLRALGTEDHGGRLTDTIMLLHLDPSREKVALLSFPRDLLVTRCDGSRGRINVAYGIGVREGVGGPTCLVQTVGNLTGIPIHHYAEVDFAGFIRVVDTVGGVTMYFEEPLRDRAAGLDVPAGCVHLDGVRALGFVRARKALDSDFGRIARQQRFIGELIDKVTSAGILLNVPRLFALVEAVASSIDADENLSLSDMRRMAFSLRGITSDGVDMRTVPAHSRRIGGAAYVVADEDEAEALFAAFRTGELFPDVGTEAPRPVGIADVPPLVILNGAGVAGLAAQAQEALEAHGFRVEDTGNTTAFGHDATVVYHPADRIEEAELLAQALPQARLVAERYAGGQDVDTSGPITVVLGSSFDPDEIPAPTTTAAPMAQPTPTYAGATPGAQHC